MPLRGGKIGLVEGSISPDELLAVPTDMGAHAGLKVASLAGGMVAGADSIDDTALLRHGGRGRVFAAAYAPSLWGRSCDRSPSETSDTWQRFPATAGRWAVAGHSHRR